MLKKFVASVVKPSSEDVVKGYEGDGQLVHAVMQEPVFSYVYANEMWNSVLGGWNVDDAVDMALTEDGPCYIVHPNFGTAKKVVKLANEALQQDLDFMVRNFLETGKMGTSKIADDVLEYIQAEAEKSAKDVAVTKEKEEIDVDHQLEQAMKDQGVIVGMELDLQGVDVVVKGFRAGDEGGFVVVDAAGATKEVPVGMVVDAVQELKINEEAKTMATNTVKKETADQVEKEIKHVSSIAQGDAAQKLLAGLQNKKEEPKVETQKEEKKMKLRLKDKVGQSAGKDAQNQKEESTMTKNVAKEEKKEAPKKEKKMGTGREKMMASGNTPTRKLKANTVKATGGVFADPTTKKGGVYAATEFKAWYLNARYEEEGVIMDESILKADGTGEFKHGNEALGIDGMAIFSTEALYEAGILKYKEERNVAIVELYLAGGNMVIPFKIALNDNEKIPSPITSSAVKLSKIAGVWTPQYAFYAKNVKDYTVECSCGATNHINEELKDGEASQACYKCEKELVVMEYAGTPDGEELKFKNRSYVQQTLPFGFEFKEAMLAQVMVFAHHALKDSFTHPNYIG